VKVSPPDNLTATNAKTQPPKRRFPAKTRHLAFKRAARRIIQRAFVLMGRDKVLRHQIRESESTTLWIVEDWEWSGPCSPPRQFEIERRPASNLT